MRNEKRINVKEDWHEPNANARQVGGDHYAQYGTLQHWDVVAHFNLDYFQGQITKYVMRCWLKNGVQDLEKARHFIDKYIELSRNAGRQGAAQADTVPDDGSAPGPGYVNQDR